MRGSLIRLAFALSGVFVSLAGEVDSASLVFPRFSFDTGTVTGIAIANLSESDAEVTLTAYGTDGSALSGAGFLNPVSFTVPPSQQVARVIDELFGSSLPPERIGWIHLTSSSDDITGFFLFLNTTLTQFDGADLPKSAGEIVFNLVRDDADHSTEVNLVNTGSADATVQLTLIQPDLEDQSRDLELPSKGIQRFDAGTLFGLASIPAGSYLRAVSLGPEIAGFEFIRTRNGDLMGLNARDAEEQLDLLRFPQFVALGPWESELGLVNYSDAPVIVTISARKPDGELFGAELVQNNPVTRGLEAGESLQADLQELFGFQGSNPLDGWLEVRSSSEAINGYVSYGIPEEGSLAAIAGVPEPSKLSVFSHIATDAGFYTGLALLNSSSLTANVRVLAMAQEGDLLGSFDTVIRPGQRISKLVTELIPETANRSSGFVWVRSDLPLYTSSLFGASAVLANVPPQEAPDTYEPDEELATIRVKPPLAVVQPGKTQQFSVEGSTGTVAWSVNGVAGGNAASGTVDQTGRYFAPSESPPSSLITVEAESGDLRSGASIDILSVEELLSGLGVLQSIVYLNSLQQLYEVELLSLAGAQQGIGPAQEAASDNQSELFQVVPPSEKLSVRTFNDNIAKMISYPASDGREYILLVGQDTGELIRFSPLSEDSRIVFTGLNQPTSLAYDSISGTVLVAEADRIREITSAFLEAGLGTSSLPSAPGDGEEDIDRSTLVPVTGVAGIAVDLCTGEVYFSVAQEGAIKAYDRSTGEIRTIVTGLTSPGQLLALYRAGVPCPDSVQLLVAEPGSERIALVAPALGAVVSWTTAPGVRDLAYLPPNNPFNLKTSIAYGLFLDLVGAINLVDVEEQYSGPPRIVERRPCEDGVPFDDPNLEAAVRSALGLDTDTVLTCEAAESLTSLEAAGRNIRRLGGIEYLINLEDLDISRNLIRDLAPLGALSKLELVDASYNLIQSPGLVPNLNQLTTLDLSHNLIDDLSRLGSLQPESTWRRRSPRQQGLVLPALTSLNLSFNALTDVTPLAKLTSLKKLDISNNYQIQQIGDLAVLTQLEELLIFQNSIADVSALSGLSALKILNLAYNLITNVRGLAENEGLGEGDQLSLLGNPISLSACIDIQELRQRGVEVDLDIECSVDLDLGLQAYPSVPSLNEVLLYRFRVANLGTQTARNVVLQIELSPSFEYLSARASGGRCTPTGPSVTCAWSSVGARSRVEAQLRLLVRSTTGTLLTTAEASADQSELNMENNYVEDTIVIANADLEVQKTASRDAYLVEEDLDYTVTVLNHGPHPATDVVLVDGLPQGLFLVSHEISSGSCQVNASQELRCSIPRIAADEQVTLTINTQVSQGGVAFVNRASAGAAEYDPYPYNNAAVTNTPEAVADLQVSKTASAEPAITGATLDYQIQVANNGPYDATGVLLTDQLPAGVTYQGASLGSCTETNGLVQCPVGNLPSGQTVAVTLTIRVDTLAAQISNTASVTADQTDSTPNNNSATALSTVVQQTDLAITKTGTPTSILPGVTETFSITVTNSGPSEATGVTVSDPLSLDLFYDDLYNPASVSPPGSGTCVYAGPFNEVSCTFPSIPSGASRTVTIPTLVSSEIGSSSIDNTAAVTGNESDPDTSNNSSTFTLLVPLADLTITKTASVEPAVTGANLEYQIQVTNNGPDAATGALLVDPLPAGVTYQGASLGTCTEASGLVQCTIGNLASGQSVPVTLTVRVDTLAAQITNQASVSADQADPNPGNNSASVASTVTQVANLAVSKTGTLSLVRTNDTLDFTIAVTNNGPSDATGVVVSDTISTDLYLVLSVPPATVFPVGTGSCILGAPPQNEVLCNFPAIPSGATRIVTIPVSVNPEPSGALTIPNTASVIGNETDPDATNNSSTYTLTMAQADLGISFTSFPDPSVPVPVDVTFDYVLDVQNFGPHAAQLPGFFIGLSPVATGYYTIGTPTVVPALTLGSCAPNIAWATCDLDEIPGGATVQITVPVTVHVGPLTVDTSTNINSREFDLNPDNDADSVQTNVGPLP